LEQKMGKRQEASWSPHAIGDLARLQDQIAVHDVAAAKYMTQVMDAVDRTEDHAEIGTRLESVPLEGEYRSIVVRNHRVVYRVREGAIRVYRVWDCRQDPAGLWPSIREAD